jgi:phenylpropionate dioxygenase-like ring-hydroxylating dioxygenase large terminal subunit
MPNVADPAMRATLQSEVKLKTYRTREAGDIVWAYLGPPERMPELPALEWLTVPGRQRFVSKKLQQCNYAQALEGAIDTAHFSFLHAVLATDPEEIRREMARADTSANDDADARLRWIRDDGAPKYEVLRRDVGLVLGGARKADGDQLYWRISQFLLPNHAYAPQTAPGGNYLGQTWVPIDDTSCWIYTYSWNPDRALSDDEVARYRDGQSVHATVDDDFVPLRHRGNDYLVDRAVQKTRSFTGIEGVSEQDACAQDSQGLIADRTREHLTPTDLGVVQWRRMVLDLARALARGEEPAAPHRIDSYAVRAGGAVAPDGQPLVDVMRARFGDAEGLVRKVSAA